MNITKREREILCMLCLPNREIAKRLGIKLETVKTHITNLKFKLPSYKRAEMLIKALKENIIKVEEVITNKERYE